MLPGVSEGGKGAKWRAMDNGTGLNEDEKKKNEKQEEEGEEGEKEG